MSTQPIIESGMTFGPYPEGRCFYIEKSNCYAAIEKHVQIAEFLLLRTTNEKPALWVVEAKSSTPHPEIQPDFDNFITEIRGNYSPPLFVIPAPPPSFPRRRESSLLNGRLRHLVIRCSFGTFFSLDSRLRGNDGGGAGMTEGVRDEGERK